LFFCVTLVAIPAFSQTLPFKNYTTADGLGHDYIGLIVRDSRGFLWFCTGEGLPRFDGYELKKLHAGRRATASQRQRYS
jgi:ligand-binding sensor domain-containing protein